MSRALFGVIGHVDHGKTALVRALTGMETDRLPEEQRRGLSIALGFAHAELGEAEIDFIDMPGHERFVRTMVSGATGMQGALLVVAANEGIKPQTREHVDIAACSASARPWWPSPRPISCSRTRPTRPAGKRAPCSPGPGWPRRSRSSPRRSAAWASTTWATP